MGTDPVDLLKTMISLVNDKFKPFNTLPFQETIRNFKTEEHQEMVLKFFRQYNMTLMSKLFGSLVSEQVNCPNCFETNLEYVD